MPTKDARHLVFIHGLAKKPKPDALTDIWIAALDQANPRPERFGYDNPGLNVDDKAACTLTYWADVFYTDYETDLSSYQEAVEQPSSIEGVTRTGDPAETLPLPDSVQEAEFLGAMSAKLGLGIALPDDAEPSASPPDDAEFKLERIPLPLGVKKAVMKRLIVEAYYYLFDKPFRRSDGVTFQTRSELQDRLIADLKRARATADRVVIVAHSMGTMIAYDCLRNRPDCPAIDGLITLGSPLGIDEVQDRLRANGAKRVDFPRDRLEGEWVNVYDRFDPVAAPDPKLANDFLDRGEPRVVDVNEQNWGEWRHTITHYLKGPKLRGALRRLMQV
ncbi:MAG: alpha/beta hydrolase [Thermodesulfobacteriota bacterium]